MSWRCRIQGWTDDPHFVKDWRPDFLNHLAGIQQKLKESRRVHGDPFERRGSRSKSRTDIPKPAGCVSKVEHPGAQEPLLKDPGPCQKGISNLGNIALAHWDVADVHNFLPKLPVPHVFKFDLSHGNEFSRKFMVQTHLPGESALDVYGDLGHLTRCQLASELGSFYRQMLKTQSRIPGVVVLAAGSGPLRIAPYPDADPSVGAVSYYDAKATVEAVSLLQMAEALLDKNLTKLIRQIQPRGANLKLLNERYAKVKQVAREMAQDGYFDDVPYSFFHIELQPRNFLVGSDPTPGALVLTGIIDWDFARFHPAFMMAKPPHWLWEFDAYDNSDSEESDEDDDELRAGDIPPLKNDQEVKEIFEEAAGPLYMQFAYSPVYRLARRLFQFTFDPRSVKASALFAEWTALRESMIQVSRRTRRWRMPE